MRVCGCAIPDRTAFPSGSPDVGLGLGFWTEDLVLLEVVLTHLALVLSSCQIIGLQHTVLLRPSREIRQTTDHLNRFILAHFRHRVAILDHSTR